MARIAKIFPSNVDKKATLGQRRVLLCNYLDVYTHDYITRDLAFMEATASESEIQKFGVREGDVLITKDSETPDDIGISAVVLDNIENLVCGYHLALLRPDESLVEPIYLAKQLATKETARYFANHASGSTRYGLTFGSLSATQIPLAPLEHQRSVSELLRALDESIDQTEALIGKMQQVRAGLMHDLFTRGILPNGQLRPSRKEAPQLYKESLLGWIPKEWEVTHIDSCGSVKLGRQRSPSQLSGLWTMPYLRVANVFDGYIDYSDILEMDFTPEERRTFSLIRGDILLNEGQSLELVGRCAQYDREDNELCFQNTLVRFRPSGGHLPHFYRWLFKLYLDRGRFMTIAKQTTSVAHLGSNRFARMMIPLLPFDEQGRIAERMDCVQRSIDSAAEHTSSLRMVKSGLMSDLLSGRVRVPESMLKKATADV